MSKISSLLRYFDQTISNAIQLATNAKHYNTTHRQQNKQKIANITASREQKDAAVTKLLNNSFATMVT